MNLVLSDAAEERIKKREQHGIRDEGLKFIYEFVKIMYIEGSKGECYHSVIDPDTNENIARTRKRRSGRCSCTHPYEVAYYLYRYNFPVEYILAAFFHDIIEDTKKKNGDKVESEYTLEDISQILDEYIKRYPPEVREKLDIRQVNKIDTPEIYTLIEDPEEFKAKVLDAIEKLSKKSKFSRPKEPRPSLNYLLKFENVRVKYKVTLNDVDRHYFWRQIFHPNDPLYIAKGKKAHKSEEIDPETGEFKKNKKVIVHIEPEDLDNPDLAREKLRELEVYNGLMDRYLEEILTSDIACVVKVTDRIVNLTDFAKEVTSDWLEKYFRETQHFFLGKLKDKVPEVLKNDLWIALGLVDLTRKARKADENEEKGEIVVSNVWENRLKAVRKQIYEKKMFQSPKKNEIVAYEDKKYPIVEYKPLIYTEYGEREE